jgi:hypothetical protein
MSADAIFYIFSRGAEENSFCHKEKFLFLTLLSFENITAALKFPHKLKETLDRFAKV